MLPKKSIKAALVSQKNAIALVYVCKEVHLDLKQDIYSKLCLHFRLTASTSYGVRSYSRKQLQSILQSLHLQQLKTKVGIVAAPFITHNDWQKLLNPPPHDNALTSKHTLILYDGGAASSPRPSVSEVPDLGVKRRFKRASMIMYKPMFTEILAKSISVCLSLIYLEEEVSQPTSRNSY